MDKPIATILLLGSFDPQTKNQLDRLKEEIAKSFSGENTYALTLDTVEVYLAGATEVLTEQTSKDTITLFIFQNDQLTDVDDIKLEKEGADKTVYRYLKDRYDIMRLDKLPIFNKLDALMRNAEVIFLLRQKEETRGGEYLELMHAFFRGHADKTWFLKKNEITLSAMLMEYLDKYGVKMRTYRDEDLKSTAMRILQYQLRESAESDN